MITKFIDRENELKFLNEKWNSPGFEFIPIYGRRRIGKTELAKQFSKDKPTIYYLASSGTKKENITSFKGCAKKIVNIDFLIDDWEQILKYISETVDKRTLIIIDEFPYLIESQKGMSSIFQRIIDLHLKDKNLFLILLGSSVGMMYREVLEYKAPLYGRRTGQINLNPLNFNACVKLLDKNIEESIMIYGICDGMPSYLNLFKEKKNFWSLLKENVIEVNSILREEPIFLLRQEFREPTVYMTILSSIAQGHTKLGQIIDYCGLKDKTGIMPYLYKLEYCGFIKKELPVVWGKKGVYKLSDFFMSFWFRFIKPDLSLPEEEILKNIKKQYNTYLGFVFEDICKQFLVSKKPFEFTAIGRQWGRIPKAPKGENTYEIDLVTLDEDSRTIGFFECKWMDLKVGDSLKILEELKEKAKCVDWCSDSRVEMFGLIGKKIRGKERLRAEGYLVWDLEDFSKIVI